MTREEVEKAIKDKTWLIFYDTELVRVTYPTYAGKPSAWTISGTHTTWAYSNELHLATAKDLLEKSDD